VDEPKPNLELTDPRALRALAHPTRLKLVGLLRREGPLTATQAGKRLGESAASCSFHLRQLAKWGLVEEAPDRRGRNRPWQATAAMTSWKVQTPEQAEAAAVFSSVVAEYYAEELLAWFERMPGETPAWREAHHVGDLQLHLTAAELDELGQRVWDLARTYEQPARPGTRRVTFLYAGFPHTDEE
jgi:DNA-binding transcriptional ArsR family regulator